MGKRDVYPCEHAEEPIEMMQVTLIIEHKSLKSSQAFVGRLNQYNMEHGREWHTKYDLNGAKVKKNKEGKDSGSILDHSREILASGR